MRVLGVCIEGCLKEYLKGACEMLDTCMRCSCEGAWKVRGRELVRVLVDIKCLTFLYLTLEGAREVYGRVLEWMLGRCMSDA